jgi:curved DNA-binding protein
LYTAVLGGTYGKLFGKVKLKVTEEKNQNDTGKIERKGFPVYKKEGQFGDLYINYQIQIQNISERKLFTTG